MNPPPPAHLQPNPHPGRLRLTLWMLTALALTALLSACHSGDSVQTDFGPEPWDQPQASAAPGTVAGYIKRGNRLVDLNSNSTFKINRQLPLRSTEALESKVVQFQAGDARALSEIKPTDPRCLLLAHLTTDIQDRVAQSAYHDGLSFDSTSGTFYLEPSAFPLDPSGVQRKQLKDGSTVLDIPIQDSRGILRGLRCRFSAQTTDPTLDDLSEIVGDALSFE